MTQAFGYLRVSSRVQLEGDGFDRQRAAIGQYAAANTVQIARWYEEQGVSGTMDAGHRPAWARMIGEIMADGSVKTVLVERLDRLARDLMIQEHIIADVRNRNITLVSTTEPDMCIDDPTRKLMRQIMGAIAEYDKTMIVHKLRSARDRKKASSGRCEGVKPYGAFPGEMQNIESMSALRGHGRSFAEIARALNESNVKTRRGARWHGFTISQILRRQA